MTNSGNNNLFHVNDYYEQAFSGNVVDNQNLLRFISSYKKIFIWGASYLGSAIGKYLQDT